MRNPTTGPQALEQSTNDDSAATSRKADKKSRKQSKKMAKAMENGEHGRVTPSNAKKLIGVAKVVGPVLAPYAAKAATTAREGYNRMRAHRLGISVDDLGRFSGKGAALHARIAGDLEALRDLRSRGADRTEEDKITIERFSDTAENRLGELASAVRAAERMPPARRRSVHHSAAGELDRIENDLLRRFGL